MKEHRHDSCFLVVAHFEVQQDTGHQYTKDTPIKEKKIGQKNIAFQIILQNSQYY